MSNFPRYNFPTEKLRNEFRDLAAICTELVKGRDNPQPLVVIAQATEIFSLQKGIPFMAYINDDLAVDTLYDTVKEQNQDDVGGVSLSVYETAAGWFVATPEEILAVVAVCMGEVRMVGHADYLKDLRKRLSDVDSPDDD